MLKSKPLIMKCFAARYTIFSCFPYIIKALNASNAVNFVPPGSGQKQFGSLMVAFVGIPARGKTVMAHKLARYLNWTGEVAKGKLTTIFLTGFM